jgi:hypothetical protein
VIIFSQHTAFRHLPVIQGVVLLVAIVFTAIQPLSGQTNYETGVDMHGRRIVVLTEATDLVLEPPTADAGAFIGLSVVDHLPVGSIPPYTWSIPGPCSDIQSLSLEIICSFRCSSDL